MHGDILPGIESVKLTMLRSPETDIDHEIGWQNTGLLLLRIIPNDNRLFLRLCRITGEKLDIEWLLLPRLSMLRSQRMPPPVISLLCQRTAQHKSVAADIMNMSLK